MQTPTEANSQHNQTIPFTDVIVLQARKVEAVPDSRRLLGGDNQMQYLILDWKKLF